MVYSLPSILICWRGLQVMPRTLLLILSESSAVKVTTPCVLLLSKNEKIKHLSLVTFMCMRTCGHGRGDGGRSLRQLVTLSLQSRRRKGEEAGPGWSFHHLLKQHHQIGPSDNTMSPWKISHSKHNRHILWSHCLIKLYQFTSPQIPRERSQSCMHSRYTFYLSDASHASFCLVFQ